MSRQLKSITQAGWRNRLSLVDLQLMIRRQVIIRLNVKNIRTRTLYEQCMKICWNILWTYWKIIFGRIPLLKETDIIAKKKNENVLFYFILVVMYVLLFSSLVHWLVSFAFYLLWLSTASVTNPNAGCNVTRFPVTVIMVHATVKWIPVTELL